MKRFLALILVLVVTATMAAGCGKKSQDAAAPAANQNTAAPKQTAPQNALTLIEKNVQYGGDSYTGMDTNDIDQMGVYEENGVTYVMVVKVYEEDGYKDRSRRAVYISELKNGAWVVKDKKIITAKDALNIAGAPKVAAFEVSFVLAGQKLMIFYRSGFNLTVIAQQYNDTFSEVTGTQVILQGGTANDLRFAQTNKGAAFLAGKKNGEKLDYTLYAVGEAIKTTPVNDKYQVLSSANQLFYDADGNKLYVNGKQMDVSTGELLFTGDGKDKAIKYQFFTASGDRIYAGNMNPSNKTLTVQEYNAKLDPQPRQITIPIPETRLFEYSRMPVMMVVNGELHIYDYLNYKRLPALELIRVSTGQ